MNWRDGLRGGNYKYIEYIPEMALHKVIDNRVMNYVGLILTLFHNRFYIIHTLIKYFFLEWDGCAGNFKKGNVLIPADTTERRAMT